MLTVARSRALSVCRLRLPPFTLFFPSLNEYSRCGCGTNGSTSPMTPPLFDERTMPRSRGIRSRGLVSHRPVGAGGCGCDPNKTQELARDSASCHLALGIFAGHLLSSGLWCFDP